MLPSLHKFAERPEWVSESAGHVRFRMPLASVDAGVLYAFLGAIIPWMPFLAIGAYGLALAIDAQIRQWRRRSLVVTPDQLVLGRQAIPRERVRAITTRWSGQHWDLRFDTEDGAVTWAGLGITSAELSWVLAYLRAWSSRAEPERTITPRLEERGIGGEIHGSAWPLDVVDLVATVGFAAGYLAVVPLATGLAMKGLLSGLGVGLGLAFGRRLYAWTDVELRAQAMTIRTKGFQTRQFTLAYEDIVHVRATRSRLHLTLRDGRTLRVRTGEAPGLAETIRELRVALAREEPRTAPVGDRRALERVLKAQETLKR
ncbi:MAG: hypothetical protein AAGA48_11995 [Myxococcota bacterium]